eukprot:gene5467-16449_t
MHPLPLLWLLASNRVQRWFFNRKVALRRKLLAALLPAVALLVGLLCV